MHIINAEVFISAIKYFNLRERDILTLTDAGYEPFGTTLRNLTVIKRQILSANEDSSVEGAVANLAVVKCPIILIEGGIDTIFAGVSD